MAPGWVILQGGGYAQGRAEGEAILGAVADYGGRGGVGEWDGGGKGQGGHQRANRGVELLWASQAILIVSHLRWLMDCS